MLLALLLLAAAPPAEPAPRYLPATGWRDEADRAFHERWFGDQLRAMNEPALSRPADLAGFRSRFRLLVLPSFHPAYAIRVDAPRTGGARVHIVRIGGAGGYGPGRIKEEEDYALGAAEFRRLDAAIDGADLGARQIEHPESLCLDGAIFLFELVEEDGNRTVTRHQCELSEALEALVDRADGLRRTVGSDLDQYRSNGRLR